MNSTQHDAKRSLEDGIFKKFPECRKWFDGQNFIGSNSFAKEFVLNIYKKNADIFTASFKEKEEK